MSVSKPYAYSLDVALYRYWRCKALELDFLDFLCVYFDSMIARNPITERAFRPSGMDILELYIHLRRYEFYFEINL